MSTLSQEKIDLSGSQDASVLTRQGKSLSFANLMAKKSRRMELKNSALSVAIVKLGPRGLKFSPREQAVEDRTARSLQKGGFTHLFSTDSVKDPLTSRNESLVAISVGSQPISVIHRRTKSDKVDSFVISQVAY